jgi:hypothetical protein
LLNEQLKRRKEVKNELELHSDESRKNLNGSSVYEKNRKIEPGEKK